MIRKAELKDLEDIVSLGVEFGLKSQFVHTLSVSEEKIRAVTKESIDSDKAVLLVFEVEGKVEGVIFGVVCPAFFSNDSVLQELALYSRKGTGALHLIDAFEEEGRLLGVKKIVVGSKPGYCDLSALYTRRGYTLLEEQFMKGI